MHPNQEAAEVTLHSPHNSRISSVGGWWNIKILARRFLIFELNLSNFEQVAKKVSDAR
jgi:hypothetical protein